VAHAETYQKVTGPLMANSHPGSYCGQDAYNDMFVVGREDVAGVDCRNATEYPEMNGTLQAKANGGFSYNCNQVVRVKYIVRRLTPTECARLQGFPDNWGHPDIKETLSDEEYAFWLNVRNTHAEINGKATKEYTRDQMLTWYNKLHTDSAELKLWGNGIVLPCALFVMQGIADALGED
jgi:DNA (cytosine-5)-methyltransferase 1